MDIVMPEKEGFTVLMEIREKRPQVKILVLSPPGSQGEPDYRHLTTLMGAAKALEKPVSTEVVMSEVDALLALPVQNDATMRVVL